MLYLFEVYLLVAASVFGASGVVILFLFLWFQLKAFGATRHRIQRRVAGLMTQPLSFSSGIAISRNFSRPGREAQLASHKFQ